MSPSWSTRSTSCRQLELSDLFSKFDPLIETREQLLSTGVTDPFNLVMEEVVSPTVAICNGRKTILLGTYNYMGMTFDPDVIAAGKEALDKFGSGTTGSRVLNGTYVGHKAVEEALKDFYAMDHAMVFSTGYQANLGIISTMAGKDDYIILDIDSHASIYDGCALGNAQIVPFRHNDVDALEKRLKRLPRGRQAGGTGRRLFDARRHRTVEGDGRGLEGAWRDGAGRRSSLDGLHRRERPRSGRGPGGDRRRRFHHRHLLQVGRHGRRLLRLQPPKFEILRLVCRPYVFTASLPPSVVATAATSIRKLMHGKAKRDHLWENSQKLHAGLKALGFTLGTEEPQSAIIAVIMPDLESGAAMWEALLTKVFTSILPVRRRPRPT